MNELDSMIFLRFCYILQLIIPLVFVLILFFRDDTIIVKLLNENSVMKFTRLMFAVSIFELL